MAKSKTKTTTTDTYSHPLLKDVYQIAQESAAVVPTYVPVVASSADRISSKIVRQAEMQGQNNTVDIFMSANLFGNAIGTLPLIEQTISCSSCSTKLNSLVTVQNHNEMKCNLCSRTTHLNQPDYEQIMAYHGYRITY